MKDSFKFDYFYGSQAEQFSFFRLPKILIRDARFKKISSDAKILYGIMLDRMSLSRENKWMDQNNRVYIIFTLKEVMKEFECCQRKAGSLMAELDSKSGIGLIERKRQGLGRPDLIYLKNFIAVQEDISQKEEKQEQGEVLPLQSGKEMPLITGAEDSFQTGKAVPIQRGNGEKLQGGADLPLQSGKICITGAVRSCYSGVALKYRQIILIRIRLKGIILRILSIQSIRQRRRMRWM